MQARIQDLEHFAMAVCRQPKLAPASGQGGIGRQSRHVQGSALFEEGQAAFIHEVPMLDTAHAALQAPIDGPRGISVSHDIEVGGPGFLDGGTDLLTGCLAHFFHAITDDGPSQAAVTGIASLPAEATKIPTTPPLVPAPPSKNHPPP